MTAATPQDEIVWKALADPSRRRILDLLRAKPRTTGELAERFSFSRFAVMKHLTQLVDAGLVLVARQGRERINHLNPVPIREIHRRWIRPFETDGADALLRLRNYVERKNGDNEMINEISNDFGVREVQMEVEIAADSQAVWSALTECIHEWWPKTFCTGNGPLRFVVEPFPGGRVFEDWGNNEGLMWYRVISAKAGEHLRLSGDIFPDYGGPARLNTTFRLEETDGKTIVRFSEQVYGRLGGNLVNSLDDGWNELIGKHLKGYVEEGKTPELLPPLALACTGNARSTAPGSRRCRARAPAPASHRTPPGTRSPTRSTPAPRDRTHAAVAPLATGCRGSRSARAPSTY